MGDIHQTVKNHRVVFFRPFSGRTARFFTIPSGGEHPY
jgi:hypothetical protein